MEISLYYSNKCNFKCDYCNVNQNEKININYKKLKKFLNNNLKYITFFNVLGGEPLLLEDKIFKLLFSKFGYIALTTNFSRKNKIKKLIKYNPQFIVSYNGKTNDFYKTNGEILDNIIKYKKYIKFIHYVLNHKTIDDLLEVLEFCKLYNIKLKFSFEILYKETKNNEVISEDKLDYIIEEIYKRKLDEVILNFKNIGKDVSQCKYSNFSIAWDGNLYPCSTFTGIYNRDNIELLKKYNLGKIEEVDIGKIKLKFDSLELKSWDGEDCLECKKCPHICSLFSEINNNKNKCVFYRRLHQFMEKEKTAIYPQDITLFLSEECNLRCSYCFEQNSNKLKGIMKNEIVKKAIDILLHPNNKYTGNTINFFGGEPSLNKEAIKYASEYLKSIKEKAPCMKDIFFEITTNCYDVSDELIEIYKFANSVTRLRMVVSMDGIKETHDKCRVTATGKPTYDKVLENVKRIKEAIPNLYIKKHCVLSKENFMYIREIIEQLLIDRKTLFNEVGIALATIDTTEDFTIEELDVLYSEIFKLKKELNICDQISDELFSLIYTKPLNVIKNKHKLSLCNAGEGLISVRSNGDILPCHRYLELADNRKYILTNILDCKDNCLYVEKDSLWNQYIDKNKKIEVGEFETISELTGDKCNECYFNHWCGSCIGGREVKNGNILINSKERCLRTMNMAELAAKYREIELKEENKTLIEQNNKLLDEQNKIFKKMEENQKFLLEGLIKVVEIITEK